MRFIVKKVPVGNMTMSLEGFTTPHLAEPNRLISPGCQRSDAPVQRWWPLPGCQTPKAHRSERKQAAAQGSHSRHRNVCGTQSFSDGAAAVATEGEIVQMAGERPASLSLASGSGKARVV
jgi:hypothetical protein